MPPEVLDCNCTLCRRYGAIWAYPKPGTVRFVSGADSTDFYAWNGRAIAFHRCGVCGCLTHTMALREDPPKVLGINARMIPTLDPSRVRLVQIDNAHTGFSWTRSDTLPLPSHHPTMDPPGPDDWR